MLNTKKLVLSWLLHHANRYHKSANFYRIKTELLKKYAVLVGYEYQFIEGKQCWSCYGTGIYNGYNYRFGVFKEPCYKCSGSGMYRKNCWNALAVYNFGKYSFHSPIGKQFVKPEPGNKIIEGYISHDASYWSRFARIMIFILFDFKGYKKRWRFEMGNGKRVWGWRPATIINNLAYVKKHLEDYLPKKKPVYDDLPF